MKNKRPEKTNVYKFDQMLKRRSCNTTNEEQLFEGKMLSIITHCSACEKQITKKNKKGEFYLCEECIDLTPPEIYVKITSSIENDLLQEIPSYINWDEEDLDYLYYTFWNNDETPPID